MQSRSLIIIGSGPAGLTAALYAARANLEPLVLTGPLPGGQLSLTTHVENYPGFSHGVEADKLIREFEDQARRFGAELVSESVNSLDLAKRPFTVQAAKDSYLADALIIATGATPRRLGLPSEEQFWAKGVSTCATCDGYFFRDQDVVVVGGGDAALEEALFLARLCSRVTVIHRREALRASQIMQDRARANEKITFLLDSEVAEIQGADFVSSLQVKNLKTGETSELPTKAVFLAIGRLPQTDLVRGQLALDHGYIPIRHPSTATEVPGLFAAGDVSDPHYRQAVTAAGQGAAAAMDAARFLHRGASE